MVFQCEGVVARLNRRYWWVPFLVILAAMLLDLARRSLLLFVG